MASDKVVCKLDGAEFDSLQEMHNHLKRFKLAQAKYYAEYYPRFDKLTGEPIPYKSYEQYFDCDFVNKNNLKKWLKENPVLGIEWSKNRLKKRREEKSLEYSLSQVELRTIFCPTMTYFDALLKTDGGYYGVCEALGYKNRFNTKPLVFKKLPEGATIICDTREQTPIKLHVNTVDKKLDVGDYGLDEANSKGVYIERKSLSDFVGTLSVNNIERFTREVERAHKSGSYIILLVENTINEVLSFNYLPQMRWTKASPDFIFKNLRDLMAKYPLTIQCIFCDGRKDAARKIVQIFELGDQVRSVDLQYRMENGEFDKPVYKK